MNMNAPRGYFPLQSMPSSQSQHNASETRMLRAKRRLVSGFRISVHHFQKHVGVGIICSVAYFDPYAVHLNVEIVSERIYLGAIGVSTSKLGRLLVIGLCFSSFS
jgi:hypothetical protein